MAGKSTIQSYRDIVAWQKALLLSREVYRVTAKWPKEEIYGLTSQTRRSSVSVPSNIAEGFGRRSPREFLHHLNIGYGSLMELETQLYLAGELGFLPDKLRLGLLEISAEPGKLINGLIPTVRARS